MLPGLLQALAECPQALLPIVLVMSLVVLDHFSWWGRRGRPDAFSFCNLLLQDVLQFGIERIELHL